MGPEHFPHRIQEKLKFILLGLSRGAWWDPAYTGKILPFCALLNGPVIKSCGIFPTLLFLRFVVIARPWVTQRSFVIDCSHLDSGGTASASARWLQSSTPARAAKGFMAIRGDSVSVSPLLKPRPNWPFTALQIFVYCCAVRLILMSPHRTLEEGFNSEYQHLGTLYDSRTS